MYLYIHWFRLWDEYLHHSLYTLHHYLWFSDLCAQYLHVVVFVSMDSEFVSPESTVTTLLSSSGHLKSSLLPPDHNASFIYRDKVHVFTASTIFYHRNWALWKKSTHLCVFHFPCLKTYIGLQTVTLLVCYLPSDLQILKRFPREGSSAKKEICFNALVSVLQIKSPPVLSDENTTSPLTVKPFVSSFLYVRVEYKINLYCHCSYTLKLSLSSPVAR